MHTSQKVKHYMQYAVKHREDFTISS